MDATIFHFVVAMVSGWVNRHQQQVIEYLQEENRVLRDLHGKTRPRLTDAQRIRLAERAKKLGRATLRELNTLVTPDTLLRWYRKLVAIKYDGSSKQGPGRPQKPKEIEDLVINISRENPGWGYTRIRDVLAELGHVVARGTLRSILLAAGIEPGARAKQENPVGHVPGCPLGRTVRHGLLHRGDRDPVWAGAVSCSFCDQAPFAQREITRDSRATCPYPFTPTTTPGRSQSRVALGACSTTIAEKPPERVDRVNEHHGKKQIGRPTTPRQPSTRPGSTMRSRQDTK